MWMAVILCGAKRARREPIQISSNGSFPFMNRHDPERLTAPLRL
jgi:hypothetical protein